MIDSHSGNEAGVDMGSVQDDVNRATWSQHQARETFDGTSGFLEPGEAAALDAARLALTGGPVLDLGVGTGRTVPLLESLTDDYQALDYLPSMVDAARSRFPGRTIQVGDARDLSAFRDHQFELVSFSFNGIDAVDHEGRGRVLDEVHRVLRPGGVFMFSTLLVEGPAYRMRPWRLDVGREHQRWGGALDAVRQIATLPATLTNWSRLRGSTVVGHGWTVAPLCAHRYRVLAHYTTLATALTELEEHGFVPAPLVLSCVDGRDVAPGDAHLRDVDYVHIVARTPR
jgi:SAM-dependent methyltransferase